MKKNLLLTVVLLSVAVVSWSQTLADYQYSTGVDSSYWYTLTDSNNMLEFTGNHYYVRSQVDTIGFAFPFADSVYTQFSVNHDGNLRLGGTRVLTSPQAQPFHATRAGQNNPKINMMGCAGYTSDSTYVHRQLFGSEPNRVLVVEFATSTYATQSRNSLMRWQVQLHENGDIRIAYPSRAPTLSPAANRQQGMCVDATDIWMIDQYHVATHYTSGQAAMMSPPNWPDINRYYFFQYPNDACVSPVGLYFPMVDADAVTFAWQEVGEATEWEVEYSSTPFGSGNAGGTVVYTSIAEVTVDSLVPGSMYYFRLRSICGSGDTSNYVSASLRTLYTNSVRDIPYYCDFEDDDENALWHRLHGLDPAGWWIDTAANNTPGGSHALYISADSGATNTNGTSWAHEYAYRDINLQATDYVVSFDWRCVGEWFTNEDGSLDYLHYMRAFLVPVAVNFNAGTFPYVSGQQHYQTIPSGWIELNPLTPFINQNSWTTFTTQVSVPTAGCYHLLFYWESDGYAPAVDMPIAIDNLALELGSDYCLSPTNLSAVCDTDMITLSWQPVGNETLWRIVYNGYEDYSYTPNYIAHNVAINTAYQFEVSAVCGVGDTSLPLVGHFRTLAEGPATSLPYLCDFENDAVFRQWVTLNEGQPNGWHVGSAVNNTAGGGRSLYVSADGGTTNSYTGQSRSLSYAYRTIVLDPGELLFSFDWRALGEDEYHYMRVLLVPAADIPVAGTFPAANNLHNSVPQGWIDLNPTQHYFSGDSSWTTYQTTFSVADSGVYALLFMWQNDDYPATNPPAAVDNIAINAVTCPSPTGFAAERYQNQINLYWNQGGSEQTWLLQHDGVSQILYYNYCIVQNLESNTLHIFTLRSLCDNGDTSLPVVLTVRTTCNPIDTLPFVCDFSDYATGSSTDPEFLPCWNRVVNHTTYSPYVTDFLTPGDKSLYFSLPVGLLDSVYVSLPELGGSYSTKYTELRFDAMKVDFFGSDGNPVFVVGVMDDPGDLSSFVAVDSVEVTCDTAFVGYSVPLLAYGGTSRYVALFLRATGTLYSNTMALVDNVELHEIPYCHAPLAVSAEAGTDSIALSWTSDGDEQQWVVSYNAVGDAASASSIAVAGTPAFVVYGLQPSTQYLFRIAAVCNAGDTSQSLVATIATQSEPPQPVCPVPVGLSVDDEYAEHWLDELNDFHFDVTVRWSGASEFYNVVCRCIDFPSDPPIALNSIADTACTLPGLRNGGQYEFMVQSVCDFGESEWSAPLQFHAPYRCIGIDDAESATMPSVRLYPNPATDKVELDVAGMESDIEIVLVDADGRTVCKSRTEGTTGTCTVSLDVSHLPAGLYLVRVSNATHVVLHRLTVK